MEPKSWKLELDRRPATRGRLGALLADARPTGGSAMRRRGCSRRQGRGSLGSGGHGRRRGGAGSWRWRRSVQAGWRFKSTLSRVRWRAVGLKQQSRRRMGTLAMAIDFWGAVQSSWRQQTRRWQQTGELEAADIMFKQITSRCFISGQIVGEVKVVADMHEHKAEMACQSDAFIAPPGGYITMKETLQMITWSQLGIHSKPMVIIIHSLPYLIMV